MQTHAAAADKPTDRKERVMPKGPQGQQRPADVIGAAVMVGMNAITSTTGKRPGQPRLRFKPRLDKIVELLVYLAEIKPNRDQYQAVKLFYLADKEHFNRYGRPITYETYFALDYGPVASSALNLIKGIQNTLNAARISRLPIEIEKRDGIFLLTKAERKPFCDLFSKSDLRVFNETVETYGDKSFGDLYNITHNHAAYKNAWDSRIGEPKRAKIFYEDMLDDTPSKEEIIEELETVSEFLR